MEQLPEECRPDSADEVELLLVEETTPRRTGLAGVLWLVLIATVVGFVIMQNYLVDREVERMTTSLEDDVQQRLASRMVLFSSRWRMPGVTGPRVGGPDELRAQLEMTARTPTMWVRVAPILAEVHGSEAALAFLGDLEFHLRDRGELDALIEQDVATLRQVYTTGPLTVPEAERRRLIERHDWYAELAVTDGLPSGAAVRRAATWAAVRSFVGVVMIGIGAMLAGIAGLVLLTLGIVALVQGWTRPTFRPLDNLRGPTRSVLLETFVLFLLAMIGLSLLGEQLTGVDGFDVSWALPWLMAPLLLWPRLRGLDRGRFRTALGLHLGRGFWREAGFGLVGYLAAMPLLAVALIYTFVLTQIAGEAPSHPVVIEAVTGGPWKLVQLYVLACIWAPLFEELAFRGAFYSHLRRRMHAVVAALISAVVFAAIHPQGMLGIPMLAAIGLTLALIREWRGSIAGPIVVHAVHNFLAVSAMVVLLR